MHNENLKATGFTKSLDNVSDIVSIDKPLERVR